MSEHLDLFEICYATGALAGHIIEKYGENIKKSRAVAVPTVSDEEDVLTNSQSDLITSSISEESFITCDTSINLSPSMPVQIMWYEHPSIPAWYRRCMVVCGCGFGCCCGGCVGWGFIWTQRPRMSESERRMRDRKLDRCIPLFFQRILLFCLCLTLMTSIWEGTNCNIPSQRHSWGCRNYTTIILINVVLLLLMVLEIKTDACDTHNAFTIWKREVWERLVGVEIFIFRQSWKRLLCSDMTDMIDDEENWIKYGELMYIWSYAQLGVHEWWLLLLDIEEYPIFTFFLGGLITYIVKFKCFKYLSPPHCMCCGIGLSVIMVYILGSLK